MYLLDYPVGHQHAIAYSRRVKPKTGNVKVPSTFDDVDMIHLPVFDYMGMFYSTAERAKIFGDVDNVVGVDDEENESEGGDNESEGGDNSV